METREKYRLRVSVLAGVSLLAPIIADAVPRHVLGSSPAADASIQGRHAEYLIRFDGPVDHQSSRLEITQSGAVIQSLRPLLDSATDVLYADSDAPAPGKYFLHWEAQAADGEISSGDIPFSVAP